MRSAGDGIDPGTTERQRGIGMSVIRVGSSGSYAQGWDDVFGKSKVGKSKTAAKKTAKPSAKPAAAKKPAAVKKAAKPAAKTKAGKKR
jgi:hypothetical protein